MFGSLMKMPILILVAFYCPWDKVQTMQLEDIEDLKDEEVILYCRSGNRSGQACLFMDALGFKKTRNLTGGMLAWQDKFGTSR